MVTLPDQDVCTYEPPPNVHGVLAAPPCTEFSLARNAHPVPRDFRSAYETVAACLRIIATCAPSWWALENPVGLLAHGLGRPALTFEPHDYGDPWTKRTSIWGRFERPLPGPFVEPIGSCGPPCRRTGNLRCRHAECRAVTPPGFARSFFLANP